MASSTGAEQFPDWEYAFIPDITNESEVDEEAADPCNWTILQKNLRSLEGSFRVRFRKEGEDETCLPLICVSPRPFRNTMWRCDVLVDTEPAQWLDPGRAAVLVREIPSPLVLTCCLSETQLTFNMTLITLAGNEVGRDSWPKEDADEELSTQEILFYADDVARQQDLLSSQYQNLCLVVEGLPRLVPDGTVLKR